MRTIQNIDDEINGPLFIFQNEEERESFYRLSTEGAVRIHRQTLEDLRKKYTNQLQEDPENSDSYHLEYMSGVKRESDSFHKTLSLLNTQRDASRLESDLLPS